MSFFPLLVAALVSASGDDVVARVDQVTITRGAVSRRVEFAGRMNVKLTPAEALESLVSDALLSAEARRLGLAGSPEVAALVDAEVRKVAVIALVESFATKRAADDATLREMFHSTADFVAFEFLAYASEQDGRAARQRIEKGATLEEEGAKAVITRLYAKPSDAPMAMRAELTRPLASALFAAKPGDLVGPAEGEKGWLVARLLRKEIGTEAQFAAKRPALVASYDQQTRTAARSHLVQQLKAKSTVKLDEAFLRGLKGAAPTPEQLRHVIATVGGTPVTYADVYPKIASLGGQSGHMASPEVKVQLAGSVVDERVLEAFALERGFDKVPEVAAQRPEIERSALTQAVAARIQGAVKPPTDREVEDHYQKNAARYGGKKLGEVRRYVQAEVLQQKRYDALMARVAELRARASISIDEAALARVAS